MGFLGGLYNTRCITHDSNSYYKCTGRVLCSDVHMLTGDKMPFLNSRRVVHGTIPCKTHVDGSAVETHNTTKIAGTGYHT
jgi:hypothetical protein